MNDFKKILVETKDQLKSLITKESSQELIKLVSSIDKNLDAMDESFKQKTEENESLKNDLIESIKATGFKVSGSQNDDSGIDETPKSLDQIMEEELQKITAKQNQEENLWQNFLQLN